MSTAFSFDEWYEQHAAELSTKRKQKYNADPAYRAKVLAGNQASKKKKRKLTLAQHQVEDGATVVVVPPSPWKEHHTATGLTLFSVGALAKVLGRSTQTIAAWEKKNLIPGPTQITTSNRKLYSAEAIEKILGACQAAGLVKTEAVRNSADFHAIQYEVETPAGLIEVPLFPVGALARALDRTPVTVQQMEARGAIPATPLRDAANRRLYSLEMIESVRSVLDGADGASVGSSKDRIAATWTAAGLMNARVLRRKDSNEEGRDSHGDQAVQEAGGGAGPAGNDRGGPPGP